MSEALPRESSPPPAATVSIKRLLGDTVIYGLSGVAEKLIGFLLLPISTAYLDPDDYGILSLFGASMNILTLFFSLAVYDAYSRFHGDYLGERRRPFLSTIFWVPTVLSSAGCLLLVVLSGPFNNLIFGGAGRGYVIALGPVAYVSGIIAIANYRLQADARPWTYFTLKVSLALITRGLCLAFIMNGMGAWGWVIGDLIGLLVFSLPSALIALREVRLCFDRDIARTVVGYSASLVPGLLCYLIIVSSDRYWLRALSDEPFRAIGLYTVGERISSVMQFLGFAFLLSWRRFAFTNLRHDEGPKLVARSMTFFFILAGYCTLVLGLLGDDVTRLLIRSAYEEGMQVIPPLTLAAVVSSIADLAAIGFLQSGRTGRLSLIMFFAVLLGAVMNYTLIPRFGILGAAWSLLAAQLFRASVIWTLSQHEFAIPYNTSRLLRITLLYLALFSIGHWAQHFGPWAQVSLVAIAPFAILFGVVSASERQEASRRIVSIVTSRARID